MAKKQSKKKAPGRPKAARRPGGDRCGLCGKTDRLTKTECCDRWICDDEDSYELFSFSRNSCSRNHRRLTLCGFHHGEEHTGDWKECSSCLDDIETEMYVYYGTNDYNFEKLTKVPTYEPTLCATCGTRIDLGEGGYSQQGGDYTCMACSTKKFREMFRGRGRSNDPES